MRPRANRVIDVLIIMSLALCLFQGIFQGFVSSQDLLRGTVTEPTVFTLVYLVLVIATFAALILLVIFDRRDQVLHARYTSRLLVVLLIASFLADILINGITWIILSFMFQFICVIAYQLYNDPNLARPVRFQNPFKRKGGEEDPYAHRDKYIPLNFFNIFWIFMVGSIVGLGVEMIFCATVNNVWECRAGLLWGPFSPIYGFGAMLMTIILNRFWNKNMLLVFVVAGLIGSGFEFFTSWYMEKAFGILAWDYSGTFLNLEGRTNFAFFLAWGFLGLMWIRLLLPVVMRFVNVIPLRWRALVTILALAFMLVDGCMTTLALNCWSERQAGVPVQTQMQQFFAENFDDAYMQGRFQTMGVSREPPVRVQE